MHVRGAIPRVVPLPKGSPNHVEDRALDNVARVVLHVVECVQDVTMDVAQIVGRMCALELAHLHVLTHALEIAVQHAVRHALVIA